MKYLLVRFCLALGLLGGGFSTANAQTTRIVTTSDTVPNVGGSPFFTGFTAPALRNGQLAFKGSYPGVLGQNGIFSYTAGTLNYIVGRGDVVSGVSGAPSFRLLGDPVIENGQVAFGSDWGSGGQGSGLFLHNGVLSSPLISLDTVEGGYYWYDFGRPVAFHNGTVAFYGFYDDPLNGEGVFTRSAAGVVTAVALGNPPFASFDDPQLAPALSDSGVAFQANDENGDSGIFFSNGSLTSIAFVGDAVPGVLGETFTGFLGSPTLSGANLSFWGSYSGGQGIFSSVGGSLAKIAVRGDLVPGLAATFTTLDRDTGMSGSDVVFRGSWSGGSGLFLAAGAGSPQAILRTGDSLFGSTITALDFRRDGLDGQTLAFNYTLANGERGIATTRLAGLGSASAPEPGTLALALLGIVGAVLYRGLRYNKRHDQLRDRAALRGHRGYFGDPGRECL